METCPETGLFRPECCCAHCLARQLEQFAPEQIRIRNLKQPRSAHSPITLITSRFGRRPSNSA
jgi:hypothetical protein